MEGYDHYVVRRDWTILLAGIAVVISLMAVWYVRTYQTALDRATYVYDRLGSTPWVIVGGKLSIYNPATNRIQIVP
jgi:hypothetical protein